MVRFFPVFCVAVLWIGAAIFRVQAHHLRHIDAEKARASAGISTALGVWAPLAFLPLAVGALLGAATIDDAFRPSSNVWGLATAVGLVVVYARLFVWIFFQDGALFISNHSDLLTGRATTPTVVKLALTAGMLGGLWAMLDSWLSGR